MGVCIFCGATMNLDGVFCCQCGHYQYEYEGDTEEGWDEEDSIS